MNKKIIILLSWALIFSSFVFLSACHEKDKKNKKNKMQTVVATMQTPVQRLYFTGTLFPIATFPVISLFSGNVSSVDFNYGERVTKDQKLLVIQSKPLADNYRKAISDFLQKKQAFVTGKITFAGTKALYKAGVIATNDYISAQTEYDNTALGYLQAQYNLEKVLESAGIDSKKIEALSLSDTAQVNSLLEKQFHHIEVTAPGSGVALFPPPKSSSGGGNSSAGKLFNGSSIKEGELLLSIGDLSGLSATFDVSEVDIDRIHNNMSVIVTGSSFPGAELKGYISAVSVQANQGGGGGGGGLSMFTVKIKIPKVDPVVMEKIRVGMTAKFEIDIKGKPRIMLPVTAVSQQNGNSVVTALNAQGVQKIVPVITGDTTPTEVVIISGVNVGDKVLVP